MDWRQKHFNHIVLFSSSSCKYLNGRRQVVCPCRIHRSDQKFEVIPWCGRRQKRLNVCLLLEATVSSTCWYIFGFESHVSASFCRFRSGTCNRFQKSTTDFEHKCLFDAFFCRFRDSRFAVLNPPPSPVFNGKAHGGSGLHAEYVVKCKCGRLDQLDEDMVYAKL